MVIASVLCVGLAAAWRFVGTSSADQDRWQDMIRAEQERSDELDMRIAQRGLFEKYLQGVLHQVERGELSLRQSAERIHSFASACYPVYFEHLRVVEEGASTPDMIAHNIVRHFRSIQVRLGTSANQRTLDRLERELHDMEHAAASEPIVH
jgi:hypothetical protein